jgi:hypothetical protein
MHRQCHSGMSLFHPPFIEYSIEQDDFCQKIMLQTAANLFSKNADLHIFLDGRPFSERYQRERVIEFCSQAGTIWAMLECVCAEQAALDRLARAAVRSTHPAANRTPDLYRHVRDAWEPIEGPRLVINTDATLDSCVDQAMRYVVARVPVGGDPGM